MRYVHGSAGSLAPVVRKYQVAATNATVGVPYLYPVLSDTDGVVLASTTAAADCMGVSVDAPGTRQTAQQSDNSDPARYVSLITSPQAVYRCHLWGGSTNGTALSALTNTVASTTGLLTTLALGTAYDDGYIWGYNGANTAIYRKVTAVAGTNETPIVAFPADIAVGDQFLACTFGPGEDAGIGLTTLLDEINATTDNQSADNMRCLAVEFRDQAGRGTTESYAHVMLIDHVYGANIT